MAKSSPQQIYSVLAACQAGPKFPSQVGVPDLDSEKRTGLGYALTPQGWAELDLGPMFWSSAPCRPRIAPDQPPNGAPTPAPRVQLVKK